VTAEPKWLQENVVVAVHRAQIAEHGGAPGVRDMEMLRSALARPQNLLSYSESPPSIFDLAACYAFGLARGHCFVDGNKRVALVSALTFLERHGWRLTAPREEIHSQVLQLAEGKLAQADFGAWLAAKSRPIGTERRSPEWG
jgi:death-on-curing protein